MSVPACAAPAMSPPAAVGNAGMPSAEQRQRRIAAVAMLALGAIAMVMTVQQNLPKLVGRTDPAHGDGPFRATVAVDGTWQLGAAVTALHRGEAIAWLGSFCVAPTSAALFQARLIDLADQRVVLMRSRDLVRDAQGCGSAAWDIVLPADLPPGRYQLQRSLSVTQAGGLPVTRALPPLAVTVVP